MLMNKFRLLPFVAAVVGASSVAPQSVAHAEGVSSSGKAIVGGGLLGAELVVIGEAIVGLEQEWMYYAGAGLGAVGGATGGYFLEPSLSPRLSVGMLMAGMALSIPALIIGMDATRRHWPEVDHPERSRDLPSDPPDPASGPELVRGPLPAGVALVQWTPNGVRWAVPDVYLTETYTPLERWVFALPQSTNYQIPVVSARF